MRGSFEVRTKELEVLTKVDDFKAACKLSANRMTKKAKLLSELSAPNHGLLVPSRNKQQLTAESESKPAG